MRAALQLSGRRAQRLVSAALAAEGSHVPFSIETVSTPHGSIRFYCLGELPVWRARTLLAKEPETIEWIESFDADDVLWDIGANVGIYSVYAAMGGRTRVLAFEPAASNYALLNRNIEMNGLQDNVQAYCIAFADATRLDSLNMQSTEYGGALSSFGEAIDNHGKTFVPQFRQHMVGFTADEFLAQFRPPFPNHLKIDVDGIEDRIVAGAAGLLKDPRLKSVSIELDASREAFTQPVVGKLEQAGMKLVSKRHGTMFDDGEYRDIYNYLFRRVSA